MTRAEPDAIANLVEDGGKAGARFVGGSYRIPARPRFDGPRMYWRSLGLFRNVEAQRGLVERFAALASASDAAINRFRRDHGPLNLCQHGRPPWHAEGGADFKGGTQYLPHGGTVRVPSERRCYVVGKADPRKRGSGEHADGWRELAAEVRAALKIAAALRYGESPNEDDWARISPHRRPDAKRREAEELPRRLGAFGRYLRDALGLQHYAGGLEEWLVLTGYVNREWLEATRVRLEVAPSLRGVPALRVQPNDLAGAIAVQLAAAICGAEAIQSCRACGELFQYVPKVGRPRLYCDACGSKARFRLAQRKVKKPPKGRSRKGKGSRT